MTDPRPVDFFGVDPVSHDPGVMDRELEVDGTRWALVEYSPGEGREGWCDVPHAGYVVSLQHFRGLDPRCGACRRHTGIAVATRAPYPRGCS